VLHGLSKQRSPMKSAPLSLDVSYPTLIHVVSDLEGSCDAGYDVECDVQVGQSKSQERRWRVQLTVKFSAKGVKVSAHKGEVTYVGIFTAAEDYPTEKVPRLVAVNAPTILYSSIRELVALLTGRSPIRSILLPTVSFIEGVLTPLPEAQDQNESVRSAKALPAARDTARKKSTNRRRQRATLQVVR